MMWLREPPEREMARAAHRRAVRADANGDVQGAIRAHGEAANLFGEAARRFQSRATALGFIAAMCFAVSLIALIVGS